MSTSSDGFGDGGAHDFYRRVDLGSCFDETTGLTQFHEACMHGCLDVVLEFLELGQDPDCLEQIASGIDPPLHLALRGPNNGQLVQTLLRAGADPNLVSSKDGSTALHVICRRPCFAFHTATMFFANCAESTVRLDARDNEGWTPLQLALTAAKDGDLVELLLAKGANAMLADPQGRTSLQLVCRIYIDNKESTTIEAQNRLEEVARSILLRGTDPTLTNDEGETFLHLVVKEDHEPSIKFWYHILVKSNLDVAMIGRERIINARDKSGCTPLHRACGFAPMSRYRAKVAEWLLRRGADPDAPNELGETPLLLMARNQGSVILAELLFDICERWNRAVRVNVRDKSGDTPLHVAARVGCRSMVQLLLRKGADPGSPNAEGSTPLHECCKITANSFLLEFMATCRQVGRSLVAAVNARNKNGDTPLHVVLGVVIDRAAIRALLCRGADPNLANVDGRTALHQIAGEGCGEEFVNDFFAICDEFGRTVQLDARDNDGNTPLHLALCERDGETAETLLRRGADPTVVNARGETPLHVICRGSEKLSTSSTNLARFFFGVNDELQRHRIAIDALDNEGRTPLQWAVSSFAPYTLDVLLDRGADLSNFVFPTEAHFDEHLESEPNELEWTFAISAFTLVECLEKRGYELNRSDAMTIMRIIDKLGLFQSSASPVTSFLDDERFAEQAKRTMVRDDDSDSTTLYDLIQLPLEEAEKRFTHMDYYELIRDEIKLSEMDDGPLETVLAHLYEIMSPRFFFGWALEPFMILTHSRLPILCCEMIMGNLNNEDLFNICLAVEGERARDEVQNIIVFFSSFALLNYANII